MPENLLGDILESLTEGAHKKDAVTSIQEEISNSVNTQFNRLFGRQKSIHNLLGGGKCTSYPSCLFRIPATIVTLKLLSMFAQNVQPLMSFCGGTRKSREAC